MHMITFAKNTVTLHALEHACNGYYMNFCMSHCEQISCNILGGSTCSVKPVSEYSTINDASACILYLSDSAEVVSKGL